MLAEKIPDLHVDYEPVLRREAAKAVLREIHFRSESEKAVKRYHVKLPDTADRWAVARRARKVTRRGNRYQTVLRAHRNAGERGARAVKAERGAHTESDTYREAFHDRLRGIADAVVRRGGRGAGETSANCGGTLAP